MTKYTRPDPACPPPVDFELDADLLETVIGLFLRETPLQLAQLERAAIGRDCEQLRAISHKLRGSSDILGTASISALAFAVEKPARSGDLERALKAVPPLAEALRSLISELESGEESA